MMKKLVLIIALAAIASTSETNQATAATGNAFGFWETLFDGEEKSVEVIKGGKAIIIADHMTEGKITIFDFYADWCGPCRALSPKLVKFANSSPNVALKKLDIVNWRSPLSKQMSRDYKLGAIPFVLIFDENGKLLGKVIGNDIASIKLIVAEGQKS